MRFYLGGLFALLASSASAADPSALAARIDKHLSDAWAAEKITPAELSTDAEFLRRATLDLIGRVPTVAEVNAFLADSKPDKRERLIERLSQTAAYPRQMALFWRKTWLPATVAIASMDDGSDEWLIAQFQKNAPYDRIARELVIAAVPRERTGLTVPRSFLTINEGRPETLAAAASRVFLGVNLDCAQCHDHPFARWTREQFWQTAAFFARPAQNRLETKILGTDKAVSAKFLTNANVRLPVALTEDTGRKVFAEWMTQRDNPYFARNAVNRLWSYFFGIGLIEPLDDLSGEVEASVPALLDELTASFIESGFDLEYLTRAIVLSQAYQLSSRAPKGEQTTGEQPRRFSRAAVRGLTGEQLYDSLRIASGYTLLRPDLDPRSVLNERNQFAAKFSVERTGTAQRAILQSLSLMNGPLTTTLTDPKKAPTLIGVADVPFLDTAGKVESLFLAAYGRKPRADESADLVKYVELGGTGEQPQRLANIFWALLNSAEFNTNH